RPESAEKLLAGMLNDPSLELRRDAVQRVIAEAARALEAGKKSEALARYQQALRSARDVDQIQAVAKTLRELGETVDLPKLFGFLTVWKVIGPFHNTGVLKWARMALLRHCVTARPVTMRNSAQP
ncbi:MAG: hypothetical protein N2689_18750, partial [Verrucomicrobiae bacterium]|nr:hypothetical protein [Verrucomicrobiae bacterium]